MNGRKVDAIFACVGGGGLLSGVAAYVKALRPEIKVIGVEADDAAGTVTRCTAVSVYDK
jgi:threonine dehydratase